MTWRARCNIGISSAHLFEGGASDAHHVVYGVIFQGDVVPRGDGRRKYFCGATSAAQQWNSIPFCRFLPASFDHSRRFSCGPSLPSRSSRPLLCSERRHSHPRRRSPSRALSPTPWLRCDIITTITAIIIWTIPAGRWTGRGRAACRSRERLQTNSRAACYREFFIAAPPHRWVVDVAG